VIYGHECFSSSQNCTARGQVQFENFKNILSEHISQNALGIIKFFIYNILNKIIKRKEENVTVKVIWTRNTVMASKLLICFI